MASKVPTLLWHYKSTCIGVTRMKLTTFLLFLNLQRGRGELWVLLPYTKVCSTYFADRCALISDLPAIDFLSISFPSVQQAPFYGQQLALPVQNEFPAAAATDGAPHWEISLDARKPWQPVLPAQAESRQQKTHQFSLRWLINYSGVCRATPWDVEKFLFGWGVSVFEVKQSWPSCVPVCRDCPFTIYQIFSTLG